ncbi:MAG: HD domain-containing protein [Polyangiaceae bacterium]|nr:HD domain-containing protein [Polyangiaceae bacterium]
MNQPNQPKDKDDASELETRAARAAAHWHADQKRKYDAGPYITHPEAVAAIVRSVPHTPEMLAAAWLHDVAEDTGVPLERIRDEFGAEVAMLVEALTKVSRPEDGDRATRKALDREHTRRACPAAKTIKLADVIDNCETIAERDPDFARGYLEEKRMLLDALREGDATLWARAHRIVTEASLVLRGALPVPPEIARAMAYAAEHPEKAMTLTPAEMQQWQASGEWPERLESLGNVPEGWEPSREKNKP